MSEDWGTGVSRTLSAIKRQFAGVVFQKSRPPLDSEFNLLSQIGDESLRQIIRNLMPSGFMIDPTRAITDYQFNPAWANRFRLGNPRIPASTSTKELLEKDPVLWAAVNGWIVPIVGTNITAEGQLYNVIDLYAPPDSDNRIDYVFLEVWRCRIDSNPATVNKPSASTIYSEGNVGYTGTPLTDDLEDPTIGYETTGRIQIQYRLRVFGYGAGAGTSVALDVYPDGLGDPLILGQGTAASPVAVLGPFANMREELGDPSLWRAGNGDPDNDFGTIDGYVYAIPICAIFRRNSAPYVAVTSAGNPNQNGAFCRTPSAKIPPNPTSKNLTTLALTAALGTTDADGITAPIIVSIVNNPGSGFSLSGSGLDDASHVLANTFLVIDGEIIGVSLVNVAGSAITIPAGGRGRYGTTPVGHISGAVIGFFNTRPDGLFADQVAETDILDLRHAVNAQDWDFNRLLESNLTELVKGNLKSAWKQSAVGDTQGPVVHEVDYLYASGSGLEPNETEPIDGPDGIRTIFSDAATIQPEVTMLLDNEAVQINGYVDDKFETGVSWDVSPGFHSSGWMNSGTTEFTDGSVIFLYTGGNDGDQGARRTFRSQPTRGVRVLTPREYWKMGYPNIATDQGNQNPVTIRFDGERAFEPAPPGLGDGVIVQDPDYPAIPDRHVGPMYPWRESNFERPFIVLGGILNNALKRSIADTDLGTVGAYYEINVGVNFNSNPGWYTLDGNGEMEDDPTAVTNPLFHGLRTLYGMLTDGGRDSSGKSSEVYVVLYGDKDSKNNNGAFRVIGATRGLTKAYTSINASSDFSIVVEALSPEFTGWDVTGNNLTVEFRSQYTHVEDTSSYNTAWADVAIVLTDIGGLDSNMPGLPWYNYNLGRLATDGYDLSLPIPGAPPFWPEVSKKLIISLTLLYHPGHGGFARVADNLVRFSRVGSDPSDGRYLRQCPATLDPTFPGSTSAPADELTWEPNHIQLWNRLPSLGWNAPTAPDYGGNVVGYTEQDREHELFVDQGSKTIFFRPFREREMTVQEMSFTLAGLFAAGECLIGPYDYPTLPAIPKDGLEMFTGTAASGKLMGIPVPAEFMPRFGRQDIPYFRDDGSVPMVIMPGINHLFRDDPVETNPVFNIIGGEPTTVGVQEVNFLLFLTADDAWAPVDYGKAGITAVGTNNQPYIGARMTTNISDATPLGQAVIDSLLAVNSSDFGRGLRGIQLPPYYGIARLMGVYDIRDFTVKSGKTINPTARFGPDGANTAPNLLREDVDKQTLFILQDGAEDYTGVTGDHTYIIPENVLDLTRCLNWNPAVPTDFADFDGFVVVCTVFGFSRNWINGNNYVLVRRFNGSGSENFDGDTDEFEQLPMVLPCPAAVAEQFYVAYNRTVYQGDVFMSRNGLATVASDYEVRYGQLTQTQQYAMRWPIQQYDINGNYVPQTPNVRTFEVLASMDFYTTMGTGKIGGQMYPGTVLDVCYTENTPDAALRKPDSASDPMWQVYPRTFTEGQKASTNRAGIDLAILSNAYLDMGSGTDADKAQIKLLLLDGTLETLWFSTAASVPALVAPPKNVDPRNIIQIDENVKPFEYKGTYTYPNPTAMVPGQHITSTLTIAEAKIGDAVVVNYPAASPLENIAIRGYVTADSPAANNVTLHTYNMVSPSAFEGLGASKTTAAADIFPVVIGLGNVLAFNRLALAPIVFPGAAMAPADQVVIVAYELVANEDGLFFTGEVTGANQITITAHNPTAVPLGLAGAVNLCVAVLDPFNVTGNTFDLGTKQVLVRVLHTPSSGWTMGGDLVQTARAVQLAIINHPRISRSITCPLTMDTVVHFEAIPTGAEGNQIRISVAHTMTLLAPVVSGLLRISAPYANNWADNASMRLYTSSYFIGGEDFNVNAGPGTSQIKLTGMTERLPTGALLQDSDFLCENPLVDSASAVKSSPAGPRPAQTVVPLTNGGDEYTRFFGSAGELIAQSDGVVSTTNFTAWRRNTPGGSRIFRMYRGGGPLFNLSGTDPGGPVDWVSESFPAATQPVLKGGILVCRAMLVRNFYEEVTPTDIRASDGDEIQMVIATYGILGDTTLQTDGLTLTGVVSPAGYGEGYAASDRYRLAGRPMFKGTVRQVPDPADVVLAVYPDEIR